MKGDEAMAEEVSGICGQTRHQSSASKRERDLVHCLRQLVNQIKMGFGLRLECSASYKRGQWVKLDKGVSVSCDTSVYTLFADKQQVHLLVSSPASNNRFERSTLRE